MAFFVPYFIEQFQAWHLKSLGQFVLFPCPVNPLQIIRYKKGNGRAK